MEGFILQPKYKLHFYFNSEFLNGFQLHEFYDNVKALIEDRNRPQISHCQNQQHTNFKEKQNPEIEM